MDDLEHRVNLLEAVVFCLMEIIHDDMAHNLAREKLDKLLKIWDKARNENSITI